MGRRMWMVKKIKIKGVLHIFIITKGVWTQVAQLNKFGVLDFEFATSWT
jgi:hypothetical protein